MVWRTRLQNQLLLFHTINSLTWLYLWMFNTTQQLRSPRWSIIERTLNGRICHTHRNLFRWLVFWSAVVKQSWDVDWRNTGWICVCTPGPIVHRSPMTSGFIPCETSATSTSKINFKISADWAPPANWNVETITGTSGLPPIRRRRSVVPLSRDWSECPVAQPALSCHLVLFPRRISAPLM